jgi:hypothetical protein
MSFTEFHIADYIASATEPINLTGPKSIALAIPMPKRRKKKLTAKAAAKAVDITEEAALKAEDEAA